MTWSGWVANAFSKEVAPPGTQEKPADQSSAFLVPSVYDDVPPPCQVAAQAIQNYNANLKVLTTCENDEQEETCQSIYENMYQIAKREVDQVLNNPDVMQEHQFFVMRLQKDLGTLKSGQDIKRRFLQRNQKDKQQAVDAAARRQELNLNDDQSSNNKDGSYHTIDTTTSPEVRVVLQQQDEHLDYMAHTLDELGNLALNLNEGVAKHAALIDILDEKSDNVLDQSRMVTRRADRLIQKKAWSSVKPTFECFVSIQHVDSQKFLAVSTGGGLVLRSAFDDESCVFGLWKRQGSIFGLQSRWNRRWMGQSFLGNLECNANSFSRRQEFEVGSLICDFVCAYLFLVSRSTCSSNLITTMYHTTF